MIPYFEQPAWQIGPLSIHAFGVTVAAALSIGITIAGRRFARFGLDPVVGQRLGSWVLLGGIAGAHLFSVLFYFPSKVRDDPWLLLRLWEDISSFGGIFGGLIAALLFFAFSSREDVKRGRLEYLDAIAFVFPIGLAIGRLGCAVAHDHPGTITTFPLAVSLKTNAAMDYIGGFYGAAGLPLPYSASTMGFHDLGIYEFLFLSLVVVPLFFLLDRRRRAIGFFMVAFAALYLPVRFCLDMLRVADVRYVGLTPAQWAAALLLAILPFIVIRNPKLRVVISGAVILAGVWACTGGVSP